MWEPAGHHIEYTRIITISVVNVHSLYTIHRSILFSLWKGLHYCKWYFKNWHQDTDGRVSAAKKDMWHMHSYLLALQSCQFQPLVSLKLLGQFLPNLHILCSTIYMTWHTKFQRNWISSLQDMHSWKLSNFLHVFLLLSIKSLSV